jgi:hypothetical protein
MEQDDRKDRPQKRWAPTRAALRRELERELADALAAGREAELHQIHEVSVLPEKVELSPNA